MVWFWCSVWKYRICKKKCKKLLIKTINNSNTIRLYDSKWSDWAHIVDTKNFHKIVEYQISNNYKNIIKIKYLKFGIYHDDLLKKGYKYNKKTRRYENLYKVN